MFTYFYVFAIVSFFVWYCSGDLQQQHHNSNRPIGFDVGRLCGGASLPSLSGQHQQMACYKCNTMTMRATTVCSKQLLSNKYKSFFHSIVCCSVCLCCVHFGNNAKFSATIFFLRCDFLFGIYWNGSISIIVCCWYFHNMLIPLSICFCFHFCQKWLKSNLYLSFGWTSCSWSRFFIEKKGKKKQMGKCDTNEISTWTMRTRG